MEILSIYHGATAAVYPKSWQYRTLITVHRELNSVIAHRKGYGPDWKHEIRGVLLEYLSQGKIPFQTLSFAATHLRALELRVWADKRAGTRQIKLASAA